MPHEISRNELRSLIDQGAQIVEVLPRSEYEEDHLPGAIHVPLREIDKARDLLDASKSVVVYCWDTACDMSPRAAWRLASLGFEVYDYVAGKLDWLAAGLPTEGTNSQRPRACDVASRDAPTCRTDERLGDVRSRVASAGWDACVVTNDERVVLGLLRAAELDGDDEALVEQLMRPGPSTFRPYVAIAEIARYMTDHDLSSAPITTSDGRLLGLLRREDATRAAGEPHPEIVAEPPVAV